MQDLLPGLDDDWLLLERERVRHIHMHALEALATRAVRYEQILWAELRLSPLHTFEQLRILYGAASVATARSGAVSRPGAKELPASTMRRAGFPPPTQHIAIPADMRR